LCYNTVTLLTLLIATSLTRLILLLILLLTLLMLTLLTLLTLLHTRTAGYRKTSGWTMPVGTLLANGVLSAAGNTDPSIPNDIYAVQQFFSKSCASSDAEPPVDGKTGICSGCGGDCTWGAGEPYTDYPGSFACLKAGAGQIAFTRQGEVPAAEEADYKLVCPDGRTLPLSAYETCNLARVPSHMVITGGARPASFVVAMSEDLTAAAADPAFAALFFAADANPDGLVFSEDATGLTPATSASVVATTGESYFAYKAISDSDTAERAAPAAGKKSKSDKNAAIALGVILAVVALASAALVFRMKKANKRLSKELSKSQGQSIEWGQKHATAA
jgi:Transferrin